MVPNRLTTVGRLKLRAREFLKIGKTNFWSISMARGWTSERRARQAELIHRWRPWERSTGPKTPAGRTKVAQSAWKGGVRPMLRKLAGQLREQERGREELAL